MDAKSASLTDVSPLRSENTRFILAHERPNIVEDLNTTLCGSEEVLPKFTISLTDIDHKTKVLTEPFREYLLSRSVLTATPVDLSILNKSSDADEKLPDSLLYCLDGNVPSDLTLSISNLAVDRDSPMRSPLSNINLNIDKSPNRKRSANNFLSTDESKAEKKAFADKENFKEKVFEIRETEL